MMEKWTKELADILESEKSVLDKLAGLAQLEREIVIAGDIKRMSACLNEQMPLVMQLDHLEDRRAAILKREGFEGKTLSELSKEAGGEERTLFLDLRASMREISDRLNQFNQLNDRLIRARLEFYDALRGGRDVSYGACGVSEKNSALRGMTCGLIDQKA